jgi:poly-beta-hydroxyalkanoate depolymerase
MSYGYNTSMYDGKTDIDFLDYRRHFLQMLGNARRTIPVCNWTPVIYSSTSTEWANIFPLGPKEPTIGFYWTWDWGYLDPSGKAI